MLSQTCIYGIQACIFLALPEQTDKRIRVLTIAEELHISPSFLSKIVNQLVQAGILKSIRGVSGGTWLAKSPHEIKAIDIVLAIDGNRVFKECLLGLPGCNDRNPCPFHQQWSMERLRLLTMFQNSTLEKLATKVKDLDLRIHPYKNQTD